MLSLSSVWWLSGYLIMVVTSFQCKLTRETVANQSVCTGSYECMDGSDEQNCPEERFNISCEDTIFPSSFSEDQQCDGIPNCVNCHDERNCENSTLFFCDEESFCIPKTWVCDGVETCFDRSDEREVGFGFKCNGIQTNTFVNSRRAFTSSCIIPQQYLVPPQNEVTNRHSFCFDKEDDCFVFSDNGNLILNTAKCWPCLDGTIIQRQQMCDAVFDCADLSDECLCERQFTREICDPLLRDNNCSRNEVSCAFGSKCIDVHQICDGTADCPNATDESRCRLIPDCSQMPDVETIKCLRKVGDVGGLATTCDGNIDCSFGQDECEADCPEKMFYCNFISPDDLFVQWHNTSNCTSAKIQNICDGIKDCEDGIDERFCTNLRNCVKGDPSSGVYNTSPCRDRCNLDATCGNIADELNCSSLTHFYCDNNENFMSIRKLFDGGFDCRDYTDECLVTSSSISSHTELIGNRVFLVALWVIMTLAVFGNLIVIVKTSKVIVTEYNKPSTKKVGLCFNILLLNLGISDFLMGFYLIIIAAKSLELSGIYCEHEQKWLQGSICNFTGVIAVLSSQMSVFLLVVMASCRLHVVLKPFKAKHMSWRRITLVIVCLWVVSLLVALVPIFPTSARSFATQIDFDQPYFPQAVSLKQLTNITKTASTLPGLRQTIPKAASLSLSSFCSIFNKFSVVPHYCNDASEASVNILGHYSTNSVCLPGYYGNSKELSFLYTFILVLVDFAAFLYMLIAYTIVYRSAVHDKEKDKNLGEGNNSVSRKQSQTAQALSNTIMRIIITDFLCWIPICIMSFLSFGGVEIPGMAYQITAIFLIPINSAVNPWIYSSFLLDNVRKMFCTKCQKTREI